MKKNIFLLLFFIQTATLFSQDDESIRILNDEIGKEQTLLALLAVGVLFVILIILTSAIAVTVIKNSKKRKSSSEFWNSERLRMILTAVNEAVIVVDTQEKITAINGEAALLTGTLNNEDAEGRPLEQVFRIINSVDGLSAESPVKRALNSGMNFDAQKHMELLSADGTHYFISARALPIRNELNHVEGALLIFRDLTREHEFALKRERDDEMLKRVFDHIPSLVYVKDVDNEFRYVLVNKAFNIDFPIPGDEFEGKNDFDLFPKDQAEKIRAADIETIKNFGRINDYTDFNFGGGSLIFQTRKLAFEMGDERKYILGISQNYTEHFQKDQQLSEISLEKQKIIDNVLSPIVLYDGDGCMIRVNPAACAITGKSEKDIVSSPCHNSFCCQDLRPEFCPVDECRRTHAPASTVVTAYGRKLKLTAQPIFDSNGKISNIIENAFDITAELENQRNLKTALESSLSMREASRSLLTNVSQKAEEPLKKLAEASQILADDDSFLPDDKQCAALDTIQKSANEILRLVKTLNDFNVVEKGGETPPVQRTMVDLKEFFKDLLPVIQPELNRKNMSFKFDYPNGIPNLELDKEGLRQGVSNLLSHTTKISREGSILELSVRFEQDSFKHSGKLHIKIADNGQGLSSDELKSLLDSSAALPGSETDELGKMRLALVLTRRLVAKMDGGIHVDSVPGKGVIFNLMIPIPKFKAVPKTVSPDGTGGPIYEGNVLIIDDIDVNLGVFGAMLKKLGIKYSSALSAMEAFTLMQKQHFDLIFTDIWMPGMDGEEFAKKVSEMQEYKDIPVVAVTADTLNRSDIFYAKIFKPLSIAKLKAFFEDYDAQRKDNV